MSTFNTISALKEGDSSVFSDLFNEYHQKVYFYVLSKAHSSYIAEEVTQITFIKLWDYRHRLDESEPVSKLIFHIARATTIGDYGTVTKGACQQLLIKCYLAAGEFDKAIAIANTLINSSGYSLMTQPLKGLLTKGQITADDLSLLAEDKKLT